jgi:hypothetical protein
LYNSLYNSLTKTSRGQTLIAQVERTYKKVYKDSIQFKDEVIVTALGINAAQYGEDAEGWIKKLWNKLKDYMKVLFDNPEIAIFVEDLPTDTTLRDLAILMNTDHKISLSTSTPTGVFANREIAHKIASDANEKEMYQKYTIESSKGNSYKVVTTDSKMLSIEEMLDNGEINKDCK